MEPKLLKIKVGWAAVAERWAVFGTTEDEALEKFREAERKREEIAARKPPENVVAR